MSHAMIIESDEQNFDFEASISSQEAAVRMKVSVGRVNQLANVKDPSKPHLIAARRAGFGNALHIDPVSVVRYLEYKKALEAGKETAKDIFKGQPN